MQLHMHASVYCTALAPLLCFACHFPRRYAVCAGSVQEMMDRERQNASSSVARERARAAAAERDAESASSQADARKRQLQHDLDNAHSEVYLVCFCWSASRLIILCMQTHRQYACLMALCCLHSTMIA